MGLATRHLMADEREVLVLRAHVKTQALPATIFILMSATGSFLAGYFTNNDQPILFWVSIVASIGIVFVGSVVPFINWLAWSITLTNERLIEQRGVLRRTRRAVLFNRLSDAEYSQTVWEKMWGTGTLVLIDLAERRGLTMRNVPRIKETHDRLTRLIAHTEPVTEESW